MGGSVGPQFRAQSGSRVRISGGNIAGPLAADAGSEMGIEGISFALDGVDLRPLLTPGVPYLLSDRDALLTGYFADGSAFSFDLKLDTKPFSYAFDANAILTLTLVSLPGDLNGDGFVGIADLNVILPNWNAQVTPGDLLSGDVNGDGFVGIGDLSTVLSNWNAGTPPSDVLAGVPEPTTLAVLGLGVPLLLRRCTC